MRAVVLHEVGGPEVLRIDDVPVPDPSDGEVRIRVQFASINHLDLWIRKGLPRVPTPRIMGADCSGVVDAVGSGVSPELIGSRVLVDPSVTCRTCAACRRGDTVLCDRFQVLGEHRSGTHAQFVVVPVENVFDVPGHLEMPEAAALGLVFATAWRMLFTRAQAVSRERVLVWGATSGVGSAALQLGVAAGMEVIATTRSADKREALLGIGADHVIVTEAEDVGTVVSGLTDGAGVDVVIDHLGEVAWKPSLQALRKGGRMVTCGATTGANPPACITRIFWKQLSILGSTMASRTDFVDMVDFVSGHAIKPRIDRMFHLESVRDAHAYVEASRQVGKVVLEV